MPNAVALMGDDGPTERTYKGDVPDDDVEVDRNTAQSTAQQPSSPPVSVIGIIAGYNQMDQPLAPPPFQEATIGQPPPISNLPKPPSISEEQARDVLLQYISERWCWCKGTAQLMDMRDIVQSSAFHYKLETFTEKRITKHAFEPFHSQMIDSAANGTPPGPWAIAISHQGLFKNGSAEAEVPHTASVKTCHDCNGAGMRRCDVCMGKGRTRCHLCHGLGRVEDFHYHLSGIHHFHIDNRLCTFCMGIGRERCHSCMGHGQSSCVTCKSSGNLKIYIKLVVTWNNHMDDNVVQHTALPDELIRGATGQTSFKEESPMVLPVSHFQDQTINGDSRQLVENHRNAFPLERIIMQRHQIRVVPVSEVQCYRYNNNFNYFVYGFENKVHAPNYPATCCCTIL